MRTESFSHIFLQDSLLVWMKYIVICFNTFNDAHALFDLNCSFDIQGRYANSGRFLKKSCGFQLYIYYFFFSNQGC